MTPDQIRQVLSVAVRAPSVHNTQPWSFDADPDVVDVRADRARQLVEQDPDGRELLLSCGAAAFHGWLGVRGLGRSAALVWSPDPDDPDLVARLTVGDACPVGAEERRLLDAVPLRHTDRSRFRADPVPAELVAALRQAAELEGAWLADEQDPDRVLELEVLVSRADQLLRGDAAVSGETAGWVTAQDHPAEGVPAGALPGHGHGRGSSLALRDFDPEATPPSFPQQPPVAEHPLLLVLGTAGDTAADWLRAGAALGRVLLLATSEGLVANPQTQVLEVPSLRLRFRAAMGLAGHPQMLLRAGWPTGPGSPQAGRRAVPDVLRGRPAD